jgi:hypothetical protein
VWRERDRASTNYSLPVLCTGIDSLRRFRHLRTSEDFFFQLFKLGLSKKVQINGNCQLSFRFKQPASCLAEEMTKLASG